MRPIYKTNFDRKNAKAIKAIIEKECFCTLKESPDFSVYDYTMYRGETKTALLEIRRRNIKFGQYPSIIVPLHKYSDGIKLKKQYNIPFIIAVGCDDKIVMHSLRDDVSKYECCKGGRNDRGDPNDIEDCYFVPNRMFTIISHGWRS